jgi:flagellar basal body rod protein FlgB
MRTFFGFLLLGIIAIGAAGSWMESTISKAEAIAQPQISPEEAERLQVERELKSAEEMKQREFDRAKALADNMANKSTPFYYRLEAKRKLTTEYADLLPHFQKELKVFASAQRKEGVSLGMTADEVKASSWGRPERVNRTTNSFGVREQWVYGGGGYLYFKDGVLRTIQN